ncbi:FIP1-like protein [Trypanosoma theileri]|uniref:FIP1-like protein n=1 Tax=Trypanosoma theileri TaxID=67003 RepID=A0A1X0P2G4_9TRYP|nr:FIP1-like protein [Trypanosoma theileri]ORC91134.1 FIP1-like protein [Trypanosoma theileri]
MSESVDNPFVINQAEEPFDPSVAPVDPQRHQHQQQEDQQQQQQHYHQHQQQSSYDTRDDTIEGKDDVVGLIPLCVRHADGPQLNTAVFGYDITQMQKRPWEDPAANLKDYFNYGFNEHSWRLYCAMQAEGEASLLSRANSFLAQLNNAAMKGAGGVGGLEDPMNTEGGGPSYYMIPQGSSHTHYGSGAAVSGVGAPRDNFLKTRMCQRFVDGRCTKGDHCSYAHGRGELRVGAYQQHHQQHQQMMMQPSHQHQHQQQQQTTTTAYVLPPVCVDQAVLPQMSSTPAALHDPNNAGGYRMMPKRQRSPEGGEDQQQSYDGSY